jgi:glucose/arabinose dehydrogenase
VTLLEIQGYATGHFSGQLHFGPDGYLYASTGGGPLGGDPKCGGQRLDALQNKILRLDVDGAASTAPYYAVPPGNPFAAGPAPEVWTYGLRNPWRFSFDRRTGDLYIGDVGQNSLEEIDYARRGGARGRNYGWSCFEGRRRFDGDRSCPGATPPILQYGRSGGECSVTGGVVVRDPRLPALAGRYVYGDYCTGRIRSFRVRSGRARGDRGHDLRVSELSSFGEDARGRVYATSLSGPVYRLRSR